MTFQDRGRAQEPKTHFSRRAPVSTTRRTKALCGIRFRRARWIAYNQATTSCKRCLRILVLRGIS